MYYHVIGVVQVPRLSGMLRAFTTQQGNIDIAAQYQQRSLELEARRLKAGNGNVSKYAYCFRSKKAEPQVLKSLAHNRLCG